MKNQEETPHICITGASGFIGIELVRTLCSLGLKVSVLTRSPSKFKEFSVLVYEGDLLNPCHVLEKFIADADILIHCAAELKNTSVMHDLHVEGTKTLLNLVKNLFEKTGKRIHWVQLSSCGSYGPPKYPNQKRTIVETSPTNPNNEYEKTKTKADEIVVDFSSEGLITYSILRPTNVFGANMTNQSLVKLITSIKKGYFFYLGSFEGITNYVHVKDVVNALIALGFDSRAKNQIFNISSDCALRELVDYISRESRRSNNFLRLPYFPFFSLYSNLRRWLWTLIKLPNLESLVSRTSYPSIKIESQLNFCFEHRMPQSLSEM